MQQVQDYLIQDLLEFGDEDSNETVQIAEFLRKNGTTLSKSQIEAIFLLRENGMEDIADFAFSMKAHTVKPNFFFKLLDKLTLADRIKGNAKLSHLLKASANPAQSGLKPDEVQAKGMSTREIDK